MPIDLLSQVGGAALRVCGLGCVTYVGLWLFRIRSSAARHAMWTVVLAGMLLQLPLGMFAPTVPLKALPSLHQPQPIKSPRISIPLARTFPAASHTRTEPRAMRVPTLTGVYMVVSMLLFFRMAFGSWALRRILRDARPLSALGPGIFESALFVVPGSVGSFRPRIILPVAWREWDAPKLRAVLAHERAHILRRDWLIRVASRMNICIFWFHPLAWWLDGELARLAEEACDDVAVSEVQSREEYAAALVDIARAASAGGGVLNWRIIAMAKDSNVVRRVNRILEARLPAAKPFGRLAWVTLLACSLPVIYLSAAARPLLMAQAIPNPPVVPAPPITQPPPQPRVQQAERPVTMCILIDNSGSMYGKRAGVTAAALALIKASQPTDTVCIVNFNDEALSALPHGDDFTSDISEMEEALTRIEARGGKAMRDAIGMAIDQMEQTAPSDRKVLVLITEGNDSASTLSQEQLLRRIRNSGVSIYSIGLLGDDNPDRAMSARSALKQLTEASGGLDYYPADLAEVENIAPEVATRLRR